IFHTSSSLFLSSVTPSSEIYTLSLHDALPIFYPIYVDEECPECGSKLVYRNGRYGRFLACSAFPKCRYIKKEEKEEAKKTGLKCPNCGIGEIVERISKKGRSKGQKFYACDRFPECKTTFSELPES